MEIKEELFNTVFSENCSKEQLSDTIQFGTETLLSQIKMFSNAILLASYEAQKFGLEKSELKQLKSIENSLSEAYMTILKIYKNPIAISQPTEREL